MYLCRFAKPAQEDFSTPVTASPLAHRLAHFLPFSNHYLAPTRDPDPVRGLDGPRHANTGALEEDVVAPFDINILNIRLLPSTRNDVLLQRQEVVLLSSEHSLEAKLQFTMNVSDQTVVQLQLLELSPWANQELGTWLRLFPEGKDVSTIGRAFGRYSEVSRDRTQYFRDTHREFATLLPSEKTATYEPGLQTLSFTRDLVTLKITWVVSINNDGEIETQISAAAAFPDTWQRTGGGAELDKVGEAFDLLVKDRGVMEAMRVVCKLIFPT